MTPFTVLSPGRFVNPKGIEVAINAFSRLFQSLSLKHQRRLKLVIVEEESEFELLELLLRSEKNRKSIIIVSRKDVEDVKKAYKTASVFLYPNLNSGNKIIPEALSYSLPILTYENPDLKEILDSTCSMLVSKKNIQNGTVDFIKYLEMLYFDPEVRKILSKGATDKYNKELNWGRRRA